MLEGVAVVWMPVQDIERAKGFYRDTLGLPITNEDGDWAEVDANGLTIGLNGRESSGAAWRPSKTPKATTYNSTSHRETELSAFSYQPAAKPANARACGEYLALSR